MTGKLVGRIDRGSRSCWLAVVPPLPHVRPFFGLILRRAPAPLFGSPDMKKLNANGGYTSIDQDTAQISRKGPCSELLGSVRPDRCHSIHAPRPSPRIRTPEHARRYGGRRSPRPGRRPLMVPFKLDGGLSGRLTRYTVADNKHGWAPSRCRESAHPFRFGATVSRAPSAETRVTSARRLATPTGR